MTKTTAKRKKRKRKYDKLINVIIIVFLALFVLTLSKAVKRYSVRIKDAVPIQTTKNKESIVISDVSVKDFTKDYNQDEPHITLSRTKDYHIFYIPDQEVFFISIVSYPFDDHRLFAEEDFLDKLGITEKEACKLNVNITTPSFANPDKAGTTYGLSFCSGKT